MFALPKIDMSLLVLKVPSLAAVQRGRLEWDEFGRILLSTPGARPLQMRSRSTFEIVRQSNEASMGPEKAWAGMKAAAYDLFATNKPEYKDIRERLSGGGLSPTLYILSMFSLWLARVAKQPLSVATPAAATILYAASQSEDYSILLGRQREPEAGQLSS